MRTVRWPEESLGSEAALWLLHPLMLMQPRDEKSNMLRSIGFGSEVMQDISMRRRRISGIEKISDANVVVLAESLSWDLRFF